jgi:U6 snRNA-associated Sm-like protein LSm8
MNMIMEECHERVYSSDAGVEQVVLGLYIVRGDNMYVFFSFIFSFSSRAKTRKKITLNYYQHSAIVGELDEEIDGKLDLSEIRAEPIDPVVH